VSPIFLESCGKQKRRGRIDGAFYRNFLQPHIPFLFPFRGMLGAAFGSRKNRDAKAALALYEFGFAAATQNPLGTAGERHR